MIKFNVTIERKGALTKDQKKALSDVYGVLWMEAYYDPSSEETREFSRPLAEALSKLNKELKFKD